MPRATQSKVTTILDVFRKLSLDAAELVYGQVQDIMRDRRSRQAKGKRPAVLAAPPAPVAAAPAPKKRGPKPGAKKKQVRRRRTPANTPLPDVGADQDVLTPQDDELEPALQD